MVKEASRTKVPTLKTLSDEHAEFKNAMCGIQVTLDKIEIHSCNMKDSLAGFREDNKQHLDLLKTAFEKNDKQLEIVAGKKQVPISIFAIVVLLISSLLVASEVRYSGLDIDIPGLGIHISRPINNK